MWHTQGLRELTQHQRAGHTTLLVSASPKSSMVTLAHEASMTVPGVTGLPPGSV
jgi:phosphoserine phosphatase